MKKTRAVYALTTLFLVIGVAGAAHGELIAPVFPGAVEADEELARYQRVFEKVFHSRQPIEEVVAFYKQEVGAMEEIRPGHEYQNVVRHPPKFKASVEPEYIGVRIFSPESKKPPRLPQGMTQSEGAEAMKMMPDRCRSDHFSSFHMMVQHLDKYDWENFEAVCTRFRHIDNAYYRLSEKKDERGRFMRMDQVMLAEQEERLGMNELEELDMDELAGRMMELQQQGRFEEMKELAEQLKNKSMKSMQLGPEGVQDNWEEWVEYLERLEKHAFRTMIRINKDPSTWPDKPVQ
ncbi:MAG: hypothetical protein ACLFUE_02020 [Desulfobacteraceae bacterium]